jgi:N-acyl-phosphatidylethanolamine-hydrolysing phospholipase D
VLLYLVAAGQRQRSEYQRSICEPVAYAVQQGAAARALRASAGLIVLSARATRSMSNANKTHHTAEGFCNNYSSAPHGSFWKWQRERWANGVPKIPEGGYHFELLHPDVGWLRDNRTEPTLTWVGHATFLLQLNGLNILTDAHFSERASPVQFAGPKRVVPPALRLSELPHIDAVVISHNHYDHLDRASVKRIAAQPGGSAHFFVPLGLKAWLAGIGIREATQLDWWEGAEHGGLKFTLTPVQHWSSRTPFDRDKTLWGGWVVEHPQFRFFFAGDTGYSQDFKDIAERLGQIDLAAIPIGAYEPRWFMKIMHVNPEEAVKIHQDLRARHSVAMHWGTFILTDEPLDEPPQRLAAARRAAGIAPETFFVMKHGETRKLAGMLKQSQEQALDAGAVS